MAATAWRIYERPFPDDTGSLLDLRLGKGIDFDIAFFEPILETAPDDVEVLKYLGYAYTRKGRYEKGLEVDKKLTALLPADSTAHYNLACSFALLNQKDQAFRCLEQAIGLGYADARTMEKDEDLTSLRGDARFQALLDALKRAR